MEATEYLQENGVIFAPGKAANAGGVATSALLRCPRTVRDFAGHSEEVDAKLKNIMVNICHNMVDAAKRYDMEGNYVAGANIAGFEKVVDAMTAQGNCLKNTKNIWKVPDLRGFSFYNRILFPVMQKNPAESVLYVQKIFHLLKDN